ncbi:DUF4190 domain-containing protein [Streptomyces sp. NPDC059816]|uniref:DUF4190 domain-containing protein n=1 Tax=Streptomyces sp. NPDC059816 TaxID=3346960 RepID=UPI0036465641
MTMPAPPGDQNPKGQEPTAQGPWGSGPWGPSAPHWPYPMATPPPRNGMGIAALVLGVVGVLLGLVVIFFWMSWLPALLALVFGCIGLSHVRKGVATNRGMALAGVILGVVGLLVSVGGGALTVWTLNDVTEEARDDAVAAEASTAAEEAAEERERHKEREEERARRLSFGETYTFGDGLKVTVAKPKPFVPDAYVEGHAKGNEAIEVTVTVVNTGPERVPVETGLPTVMDADGVSAELVIDGSGRQKIITGHVLPGKQAVGKYAYSLPPDAADEVEVQFSPDLERWADSYWSGPN